MPENDLMDFARWLGQQAEDDEWKELTADWGEPGTQEFFWNMAKHVRAMSEDALATSILSIPHDVLVLAVKAQVQVMSVEELAMWLCYITQLGFQLGYGDA